jgi:hypothetical protein
MTGRNGSKCIHERYFQTVGNLGDDRAFRKEAEELPADFEGERSHKDAESGHFGREEHEGEGVAAKR